MRSNKKYSVSFKYQSSYSVPFGWEWRPIEIAVKSYLQALKKVKEIKNSSECKDASIKITETIHLTNKELDQQILRLNTCNEQEDLPAYNNPNSIIQ